MHDLQYWLAQDGSLRKDATQERVAWRGTSSRVPQNYVLLDAHVPPSGRVHGVGWRRVLRYLGWVFIGCSHSSSMSPKAREKPGLSGKDRVSVRRSILLVHVWQLVHASSTGTGTGESGVDDDDSVPPVSPWTQPPRQGIVLPM